MRKKKTTKKVVKKVIAPKKSKTASDIFAEYIEITQEKTKVILEICEMMHLKAAFENEIVLSKLQFKEDTTTDLMELEQFMQDMERDFSLLGNVEADIEILNAKLDNLNLKLNNL